MKLIICGNGFDLHHGFKTGYYNYRNFLMEHYPDSCDSFEEFPYINLSGSDKWSDLEQSLTIGYEECIENAVDEWYPDLNDDSDSRWHGIEIDLEEQTKFIFDFTGRYFFQWFADTDFSDPQELMNLDANDCYLTFNYTNTLEKVYNIKPENIMHIHGQIDFEDESGELARNITDSTTGNVEATEGIQFGSVENNDETIKGEMERKYGQDDFYGASIEPGVYNIIEFCKVASKNLEMNYDALKNFINNKDIEKVVVMGHSLIGVDCPYYADIIIPKFKDCRWLFYWHFDSDKQAVEIFIDRFSITNFSLVAW